MDEFIFEGLKVSVQVPELPGEKPYPVVLVNDGHMQYLQELGDRMILVSIQPEERLNAFTPWKAAAIRSGAPDFGGAADSYHHTLFRSLLPEIVRRYPADLERLAYGGYSLGGLAAVYSLFCYEEPKCVFSLCGSFWYPGFAEYTEKTQPVNKACQVYLLNGRLEGANHNNRLEDAPIYAGRVHRQLQKIYPGAETLFDPYGHHENTGERYHRAALWLSEKLI